MNDTAPPLPVLLVDDSGPVRQRIRSLVEETQAATVIGEAAIAGTALALFQAHAPAAVILELGLAGASGLLAEIKRLSPACVVIMLGSSESTECRDFCLRRGADHYFSKHKEFERVPEVLRELHSTRTDRPSGGTKP
ncbi:MAG: response regulator [Opitutae bacterium]|nr:response regulator [Opitutae bacterium]